MKKSRNAEYFTDETGRRLVRVPVTGSDRPLITEAALYDNARARGRLRGALYLNDDGQGSQYVYARHPAKRWHSTAARVLLDCRSGYRIRYVDGDSFNHLPENYRLEARWADSDTAREALDQLLTAALQPADEEGRECPMGNADV